MADMEVGEDARLADLHDVLAEPGEIAWPGGAHIEPRGRAAAPGQCVAVDADGGATPVDMGVEV